MILVGRIVEKLQEAEIDMHLIVMIVVLKVDIEVGVEAKEVLEEVEVKVSTGEIEVEIEAKIEDIDLLNLGERRLQIIKEIDLTIHQQRKT